MNQIDMGEVLRAWRKKLGLSQQQVADRSGLTKSRVSQIERGDANALETLDDVARTLGAVWAHYLLVDGLDPERARLIERLVMIIDRLDDRDVRQLSGMVRLYEDEIRAADEATRTRR